MRTADVTDDDSRKHLIASREPWRRFPKEIRSDRKVMDLLHGSRESDGGRQIGVRSLALPQLEWIPRGVISFGMATRRELYFPKRPIRRSLRRGKRVPPRFHLALLPTTKGLVSISTVREKCLQMFSFMVSQQLMGGRQTRWPNGLVPGIREPTN